MIKRFCLALAFAGGLVAAAPPASAVTLPTAAGLVDASGSALVEVRYRRHWRRHHRHRWHRHHHRRWHHHRRHRHALRDHRPLRFSVGQAPAGEARPWRDPVRPVTAGRLTPRLD
ncbi:hypothetical protein [Methylobacterium radiodurans]|uniref:hypothetical protein n=1 Tax=Methylobacterium radiodurans TaxID=2202828 RepID=UPI0019527D84|nr:hypothetical protein [Methylobacterium radiodurans]